MQLAAHDRPAACHGFDLHDAKAFRRLDRRQAEHVAGVIPRAQFGLGDAPHEMHAVGDADLPRNLRQLLRQRPLPAKRKRASRQLAQGTDQELEALVVHVPAERENQKALLEPSAHLIGQRLSLAEARQVEAVGHDVQPGSVAHRRQLLRGTDVRGRRGDDGVGRAHQPVEERPVQRQQLLLADDVAVPGDDPLHAPRQERGGKVRHRVGGKLQVHQVEGRAAVARQGVPGHGRAYGSADEVGPGTRIHRLPDHGQVGRAAALGDDVGVAHLWLERTCQLEHIALQAAEVVVGVAAEGQHPNHVSASCRSERPAAG
jgi:hypothetical protein